MGEFSGLIMMFVFLLLLVVGGVAYALLSMYVKLRRIAAEREEKGSAGFVVDTFHGLVTQLKENERELEVLRQAAETRADITEEYNENILQSVPSGVISMDANWKVVLSIVRPASAAFGGQHGDAPSLLCSWLIGFKGSKRLPTYSIFFILTWIREH